MLCRLENHLIPSMQAMSKALDVLIADCDDESRPVHDCSILGALEQVNREQR